MMTREALATGPTGKSMPVRALLDSGADISSVTTQVAKHLKLQKLDATMAVETFGDANSDTICPNTHFTLSSFHRKDWCIQVSAAVIKKITGNQPRQDASIVRRLPGLEGLTPADPHFDKPERIDVLLGADVLPHILTTEGPSRPIKAVETVFGHAFMGTYQTSSSTQTHQATIQLAKEKPLPDPEQSVQQALTKFWELEEPVHPASLLTTEEKLVEEHYVDTHAFIPSAGRYQVVLPKNSKDLKLGESKSKALLRFHSNERALLRRGNWDSFQAVIQEYLDLDHAQPVTEGELRTPQEETYYLPMHGVYK